MTEKLKTNEYFDGRVKSIQFEGRSLPSTVGVMQKGDYTFKTQAAETMSVIAGQLQVKLPNSPVWQTFVEGQVFEIPANSSFDLQVDMETAYLCQFHKP